MSATARRSNQCLLSDQWSKSSLVTQPLTIVARLVLGVIFIYAGWNKIGDPAGFAKAVQNYRLLPLEMVNLFAIVVPWIELVCGLLLIVGLFTAGSSLVVTLLLLSFMIALAAGPGAGARYRLRMFFKQERRPHNLLVSVERFCPGAVIVADPYV